jgi:hypothetical protein
MWGTQHSWLANFPKSNRRSFDFAQDDIGASANVISPRRNGAGAA